MERQAQSMITLTDYCRREFGEKLYKLSLSSGCTCPNRDGTLGTGGCIFCSEGGSGDFSEGGGDMDAAIERAKRRVAGKYHGGRYIAYFQAFSNTYGDPERLEKLYRRVIARPDIAVLDIATRPDCLGPDILRMLGELAAEKPLWVELGLQTVKRETVDYIRRGYDNAVYAEAIRQLNRLGIHTVTHVILGLPGEAEADMTASVRYAIDAGTAGIKLQLLHVLEGTALAADYRAGRFETLTEDAYFSALKKCTALLKADTVVHRLTGDGPRRSLIAPLWSLDKKRIISRINREILQGGNYERNNS